MTIGGVLFYFWPPLPFLVANQEKWPDLDLIFSINTAFLNGGDVFPFGFPILLVVFRLRLTSFSLHFLTPSLSFFFHPLCRLCQMCVIFQHWALNTRLERRVANTLPPSVISISVRLWRLLIPVWRNNSVFQNTVRFRYQADESQLYLGSRACWLAF